MRINKNNMDKILTTLFLLSYIILLSGCDNELIDDNNDVYSVTTNDVSGVGMFSAVLNAKINMPKIDGVDYMVGFQLSTDSLFPGDYTQLCLVDKIEQDGSFSFSIYHTIGYDLDMPSLKPGTHYYFRAFIKFNDLAYVGGIKSFTTVPLEITTGVMDSSTNAINCKVNLLTEESWISGILGVCYSNKPEPTINDYTVSLEDTNISLKTDGTFTVVIDDLLYGGYFYYRTYYNDKGTVYYGNTHSVFIPYTAVDMGLSVKWANCNLGAITEIDYGYYYAWGETTPKTNYDWSTYKYCEGSRNKLTKYCSDIYSGNNYFVDNKNILDPEDDAAQVEWGDDWRMPTLSEINELIDSCTWIWTSKNGVSGYKITSNMPGYTDRFIFLPAAGYREGIGLRSVGVYGCYWCKSLYTQSSEAKYLFLISGDCGMINHTYRTCGHTVRPVCQ